ncbi:FecR family protein [Spirosoma sp.]|uniref:FecR family protein n=1 Tax=Spirosoma sp. TaxID=1899569 RepID=UPI0026340B40|nr:FecR family protein [Spirosoma sp.]MCX6217365.1 FecR family protein [Spirosoma sp.]
MKNYQDYQLTDFLLDESFNRWARRESSPEEGAFWQNWLSQYPDKREVVEQARLLITGLRVKPYREITEQELFNQVDQIRLHTNQRRSIGVSIPKQFGWWARTAAIVLLVSVIGMSIWVNRNASNESVYVQLIQNAPVALIEKANTTRVPLSLHLPDGSQVTLQPNSRISFSKQFKGDKREVYLMGEAFFNVRKNPRKPFYVHANEVVTKVLGTSFTVEAYDNQANVQVAVRTGQVSVFARNDWQRAQKEVNSDVPGVVLTPNQKVVFNRQEGHFHRTIIPNPVIINHRFANDVFVYDETPVTKIFTQLEDAYGVDIVFDEQLLKHCTLTARFHDEPLLEKLNLICQITNASYQIVDAQIVISAQGC